MEADKNQGRPRLLRSEGMCSVIHLDEYVLPSRSFVGSKFKLVRFDVFVVPGECLSCNSTQDGLCAAYHPGCAPDIHCISGWGGESI